MILPPLGTPCAGLSLSFVGLGMSCAGQGVSCASAMDSGSSPPIVDWDLIGLQHSLQGNLPEAWLVCSMDECLELLFVHDVNISTTISLHYHIIIIIQPCCNSLIVTTILTHLSYFLGLWQVLFMQACEFSMIGCLLNPFFFPSAWLLFSGLVAMILPSFAHRREMVPFVAPVAFLTKWRAIFSFLMNSSQSIKLTFMLFARGIVHTFACHMQIMKIFTLCSEFSQYSVNHYYRRLVISCPIKACLSVYIDCDMRPE